MSFLKSVFSRFIADDCTTMAAALAYYTLFALPPLLYLLLTIVTYGISVAYETEQAELMARELIAKQASALIGNETATDEITSILARNQQQSGTWWKTMLSVIGILFGATGVVAAAQNSLNRVWRVEPDPAAGGVKNFVFKRILSFAMILGLGFLLLVSMVVSTALAAAGSQIGSLVGLEEPLLAAANYTVNFLVTFVIFVSLLKFMPDAQIEWKDAWLGALLTSVLFSVGRWGMEFYFEHSNPAAQLGSAAASLAVLLIWVYYTAMIIFLGAEFTCGWAGLQGRKAAPEPGAVNVVRKVVRK